MMKVRTIDDKSLSKQGSFWLYNGTYLLGWLCYERI